MKKSMTQTVETENCLAARFSLQFARDVSIAFPSCKDSSQANPVLQSMRTEIGIGDFIHKSRADTALAH